MTVYELVAVGVLALVTVVNAVLLWRYTKRHVERLDEHLMQHVRQDILERSTEPQRPKGGVIGAMLDVLFGPQEPPRVVADFFEQTPLPGENFEGRR